ncbi:MAG: TlpA family protein disulfide reductase [Saprospiraceae bacterium]|nr:TlpA family protein disulfide reductase [Saprospiraceae bacterium]
MAFKSIFYSFLLFVLSLNGCVVVENSYEALPPGIWRGVLQLDPLSFVPPEKAGGSIVSQEGYRKEMPKGSLPFQFEVIYDNEKEFHIELINGSERITVPDIGFGRNIRTAIDTVYIDFPVYDSYIQAQFRENILDGYWVVRYKEDYKIPFVAQYGEPNRYTDQIETPATDLSGKWEVVFSPEEDPYPAIGEFQQTGNKLTGTFLTETGDYRYLEGTIQDDWFSLSVFDGAHAFLFEGKVLSDDQIIGSFRSGKHYQTTWSGSRNPNATLADPDSLTFLKPEAGPFTFSFPDANGQVVSLTDREFDGKYKIVQILGTWCPNCRDETLFLKSYLEEHPQKDLAVIGLAFERYQDPTLARAAIARYQEKLDLPYPVLHAGNSNKEEAALALPMLNHILSFPTLIFLNRTNEVLRIHTGFSGPATSAYADFVADFEAFLDELE